jgi:hypothetical protein
MTEKKKATAPPVVGDVVTLNGFPAPVMCVECVDTNPTKGVVTVRVAWYEAPTTVAPGCFHHETFPIGCVTNQTPPPTPEPTPTLPASSHFDN